jgi:hypothetical protein
MKTIYALPIVMALALLTAVGCTSAFPAGIDDSASGGSRVDSGTGGVAGTGGADAGSGGTVGGTTGCGSAGSSSPLGMLPADNQIGTWALSGAPGLVSQDAALYNMIDGAAPKYIDRGWVSSAYATYQQSGSNIQVAIYDMGNSENAQALFTFELPASRIEISKIPSAVIDMGLPTGYGAYAWSGQYVIEISIDDHSDAALTHIEMFTLNILERGCAAGTDAGGAPDLAPDTAPDTE